MVKWAAAVSVDCSPAVRNTGRPHRWHAVCSMLSWIPGGPGLSAGLPVGRLTGPGRAVRRPCQMAVTSAATGTPNDRRSPPVFVTDPR